MFKYVKENKSIYREYERKLCTIGSVYFRFEDFNTRSLDDHQSKRLDKATYESFFYISCEKKREKVSMCKLYTYFILFHWWFQIIPCAFVLPKLWHKFIKK